MKTHFYIPKIKSSWVGVYLFLCCLCCWVETIAQNAKEILHPIMSNTNSQYLTIQKIVLNDAQTTVHFELSCFEGLEAHIFPASHPRSFKIYAQNKTYKLIKAEGIELGTIVCSKMEIKQFKLIFEALPPNTETISIAEEITDEEATKFNHILLCNLPEAEAKGNTGDVAYLEILGSYFQKEYDYEKSKKYFSFLMEKQKATVGESSAQYLHALNLYSKLLLQIGEYETAEKAISTTIAHIGKDNPLCSSLVYSLGDLYQILGEQEKAIDSYIQYVRISERQQTQKSAFYSTVTNLIMYSYSYWEDEVRKKPIIVGVALNPTRLSEGIAQMKVFAVGADSMAFSKTTDFSKAEWLNYDNLAQMAIDIDQSSIFVKCKDKKEHFSEIYEVKILRK